MIAADRPIQRPRGARLLVLDETGRLAVAPRASLPARFRPGDLVVANDAATLPASLAGTHRESGRPVELRLAGRASLRGDDLSFVAVVFGEGDYRTRTEDRAPPPRLAAGDRLDLGPLVAEVERLLGHPRLAALRFLGSPAAFWDGLARAGRPIQYAHMPEPLALWDVWTRIAAQPVAFEPPSAGFVLDWALVQRLRGQGVAFATLTHAAGISSTGDAELDRRLPFDEPYRIPAVTADAVNAARADGRRVIAIGTTVVRALEAAAEGRDRVPAGEGVARIRLGPATALRAVDVLVSGVHEPGSSHYDLLGAFTGREALMRADALLELQGFRTHEFGDSVWIARRNRQRGVGECLQGLATTADGEG